MNAKRTDKSGNEEEDKAVAVPISTQTNVCSLRSIMKENAVM